MQKVILGMLVLVASGCASFGQSTILWNESINGPFSSDYNNPTALRHLPAGTNSLYGVTEVEPVGNNYFVHEDFFTFIVPTNSTVVAVYLQIEKPNVWTWLGNQRYSAELAYVQNSSTGNLLSQWGLPLIGDGAYGMYISNHDFQPEISFANYRIDFVVIPEPSSLWLLLGGLGWLGIRGWRNSQLKT